jgi:hypothetical protein
MAKITYYLGAGASCHACPILENQALAMIKLAEHELREKTSTGDSVLNHNFSDEEIRLLPDNNRIKILWYIGYFGKKARDFNTVDTYARKLALSGSIRDLNFLKMSISVFFDLWENFYYDRYYNLTNKNYKPIDHRYISLFSILLNKEKDIINLNNSFKFITWNYDLQLESTFKSFLSENKLHFETLHNTHFRFMENNNVNSDNDVFHLNGHRGFISNRDKSDKENIDLNYSDQSYEDYWNNNDWLFNSIKRGHTNFRKFLKYAWEHDLKSEWFNKISNVLKETEILVVIGYSFPPFNREIDQYLFSKLNPNKIKKIVYQDPNANKQLIENLFINPIPFKDKIEIEKDNLNQFYLPNEHFITQNLNK